MRQRRSVWAWPVRHIYRCPRCGKVEQYGTWRTLWSLLPGVCHHAIVDMASTIEHGGTSGLAYITTTQATIPVREKRGLRSWLRGRLSQEVKGKRHHWWGPLTAEEKGKRAQIKAQLG